MNSFLKWAALAILAAAAGCSESDAPGTDAAPSVYTTFYPTTYFTRRIAGGRVKVVCPIPAGEDPIFWMPKVSTIAAYQQADLIVVNGAGFEKWVDKVSLPSTKVVDTAGPLEKQLIRFESAVTHSHGPAGQHSHEGLDGHTWLDPGNAKVQANEIRKALASLLPARAEEFQANYTALAGDLDELHAALLDLSQALGDRRLLASHPAYNYLARRYGWKLTSLDLDPQEMPPDEVFAEIRAALTDTPAHIILWEAPPRRDIAGRFEEELKLISVTFSPCELPPDAPPSGGPDYMKVMRDNIARLRAAMAK